MIVAVQQDWRLSRHEVFSLDFQLTMSGVPQDVTGWVGKFAIATAEGAGAALALTLGAAATGGGSSFTITDAANGWFNVTVGKADNETLNAGAAAKIMAYDVLIGPAAVNRYFYGAYQLDLGVAS